MKNLPTDEILSLYVFKNKSLKEIADVFNVSSHPIRRILENEGVKINKRGCNGINKKHGLSNHKLYSVWSAMIQRCTKSNCKSYKHYGGRGIKVCDRWLEVTNFIEDMYATYKAGLELDRIDNDGGYSSENCQWVTPSKNKKNKRNSVAKQSNVDYVSYDTKRNKWRIEYTFDSVETAEYWAKLIVTQQGRHKCQLNY